MVESSQFSELYDTFVSFMTSSGNILFFSILIFCLILVATQILKYSFKAKTLWYWNVLLLPSMTYSFSAWLLLFLELPESDPTTLLVNKIAYSLLWIMGAWLLNTALDLFIWKDLFIRVVKKELPKILIHLSSGLIYLIAIYSIFAFVLGHSLTGLLVSTSVVVGVAGFALQNILSDFFSGIAIHMSDSYSIGEWIALTEDGIDGKVVDVNWRTTTILTWENNLINIPNHIVTEKLITNFHQGNKQFQGNLYAESLKYNIDVDLPYERVRQILLNAALSVPCVKKYPGPYVRCNDFTKRPFTYSIFAFFEDYGSRWDNKEMLMIAVHEHLSKEGIKVSPMDSTEVVHSEREKPEEFKAFDPLDTIKTVPLFNDLTDEELRDLSNGSHQKILFGDLNIITAKEQGSSLFILREGIVRIMIDAENGPLEVARLSAGSYFGEMSLLTGEPRSATVQALSYCVVYEITKEALRPILESRPVLIRSLSDLMAERNRDNLSKEAKSQDELESMVSKAAKALFTRINNFFNIK